MARSKILKTSDRDGTDRRTFLLALPPAVGSLAWTRGSHLKAADQQLHEKLQRILDSGDQLSIKALNRLCDAFLLPEQEGGAA